MENKSTSRISCKESSMKLEERLEKWRAFWMLRNRYCGRLSCLKRQTLMNLLVFVCALEKLVSNRRVKNRSGFFVLRLKVFNRIYHASFAAVCFSFDFWFYREITHFIYPRSTKDKRERTWILCTQAHNNTYMDLYHIQFDIYLMFGFRGQCAKWIA